MKERHNLTLGGVIMLVVLTGLIASGYFWYAHAKSVRLREDRAAKVAAAEKKIIVYEDDIKKLEEDKKSVEAEADALEPKIKAAKETADASAAKAKELNGYLSDFRRKMDDTRRAVDQQNRNLRQNSRNVAAQPAQSGASQYQKQIAEAENNLKSWQKELEKVECHYNEMGHETYEGWQRYLVKKRDNSQLKPYSKYGTWSSDRYWTSKRYGYRFQKPLPYLDYRNEVSRINANIDKCEKQIESLKYAAAKNGGAPEDGSSSAPKEAQFNANAWNAKYAEHQETVRKAQETANEDRKALDKLNEEKRDLDSKINDIERKIENNETAIKNERLLIAENQK